MKKEVSCVFVLVAGLSSNAFASAGYAHDGFQFILLFAGFLALVAGLLKGIDILHRNGKALIRRITTFIRKKSIEDPMPKPPDSGLLPFSI